MPEEDNELYKLIKVSGADAVDFLQGQLTQDVALAGSSEPLLAAWCNPQGRVIATMQLTAAPDWTGLSVAQDIAVQVCENLTRFRFRSKVDFEIADEAGSIHPSMTALIESGTPLISTKNSEKFTPHMLNLDRLNAVSFSKGCYTGQEIVARTEHRGVSKRRLMRYRAENGPIATGDKLSAEGRNIGEVVNTDGANFLAVTPVAMHEHELEINGEKAKPLGLPYPLQ